MTVTALARGGERISGPTTHTHTHTPPSERAQRYRRAQSAFLHHRRGGPHAGVTDSGVNRQRVGVHRDLLCDCHGHVGQPRPFPPSRGNSSTWRPGCEQAPCKRSGRSEVRGEPQRWRFGTISIVSKCCDPSTATTAKRVYWGPVPSNLLVANLETRGANPKVPASAPDPGHPIVADALAGAPPVRTRMAIVRGVRSGRSPRGRTSPAAGAPEGCCFSRYG